MATFLHTSGVGDLIRDDVSEVVTNIDPIECPLQANIGEVSIDDPTEYQWMVESLDAPNDGGFLDGFQWSDITGTTYPANDTDGLTKAETFQLRSMLRAVCQIQARGFEISNRFQETPKYGIDDEIGHQLALYGDMLKRDCEKALHAFRSPVDAGGSTAPLTAGVPAWIRTNTSFNTVDGADPTLSGGEPVVGAGADGTTTGRALSEATLLDLVGQIYDNGGNPTMIEVSRDLKQGWSAYMLSGNARSATQYQDQGRKPNQGIQVVGAVDYYVSDFSVLSVVPNRFSRASDVTIYDTSLWEKGTFRNYEVLELGIEGDSQRFIMLHDFALISRDESGSAIIRDLDDTLAMTA